MPPDIVRNVIAIGLLLFALGFALAYTAELIVALICKDEE